MPQFNIFNLGLFLLSLFLIGCSQDISNKKDIGRDLGLAGSKDILKQEIFLDVELGELNISGQQKMDFISMRDSNVLLFDSGAFSINSASLDGHAISEWTSSKGETRFVLPKDLIKGGRHRLVLSYEASPKRGFGSRPELLYTGYFACDWMVCDQNAFDDRFKLDIQLAVKKGLTSIGPGTQLTSQAFATEKDLHSWTTQSAYPAYVFAFAVGNIEFEDVSGSCDAKLRVARPAGTPEIGHLFSDTCKMLEFFENKSRVVFPFDQYVQLYVPESGAAQEAVSHSILGSRVIDPMQDMPSEDWAIAHELAHQWWGNRTTAADLQNFWLNEAIVTFMVASWKETRWGSENYDHEIGLAKARWDRAVKDWKDVPIAHAGEFPSLGHRRAIQYSKGAVFLDQLRHDLGEEAFWQGMSNFTQTHWGNSVRTVDFQRSMEQASGRTLQTLFDSWVYDETE